jgi:Domain of unknown function (DU1801)
MAGPLEMSVDAYLDSLEEPRRSHMRHLHTVISDASPGVTARMWEYAGGLIGYGTYDYRTSSGSAGEWFAVGLASRKRYISLYSMAAGEGGYLVETMRDRFPGVGVGRSCLNITRPASIDDNAVRELVHTTMDQFRERLRQG